MLEAHPMGARRLLLRPRRRTRELLVGRKARHAQDLARRAHDANDASVSRVEGVDLVLLDDDVQHVLSSHRRSLLACGCWSHRTTWETGPDRERRRLESHPAGLVSFNFLLRAA